MGESGCPETESSMLDYLPKEVVMTSLEASEE